MALPWWQWQLLCIFITVLFFYLLNETLKPLLRELQNIQKVLGHSQELQKQNLDRILNALAAIRR